MGAIVHLGPASTQDPGNPEEGWSIDEENGAVCQEQTTCR